MPKYSCWTEEERSHFKALLLLFLGAKTPIRGQKQMWAFALMVLATEITYRDKM